MRTIKKYFKSYKGDILAIIIFIITNILTWFFTSHDVVWGKTIYPDGTNDKFPTPWVYNINEALSSERQLTNCLFEMLHMYYMHDVEKDSLGMIINKHTFWDDCISETDSYIKADSILNGCWDDFYEEW